MVLVNGSKMAAHILIKKFTKSLTEWKIKFTKMKKESMVGNTDKILITAQLTLI